MTRHNEILNKFKCILPAFDFTNKEHKDVVRGDPTGVCSSVFPSPKIILGITKCDYSTIS